MILNTAFEYEHWKCLLRMCGWIETEDIAVGILRSILVGKVGKFTHFEILRPNHVIPQSSLSQYPDVRPSLDLQLHPPILLLLLLLLGGLPLHYPARLPSRLDRADQLRLPHPVRDGRALCGRVSTAQGARALYLRARQGLRAGGGGGGCHIQHTKVLNIN